MKRILLLLFVLLSLSQAKASDTLTVRQVFNFSVGDTFDYRSTLTIVPGGDGGPTYFGQTYSRYIITAKTISADSDTVTYIRQQLYPLDRFDTLIYTNLDSSIFEVFDMVSGITIFDTSSLPDGRLIDSLSVDTFLGPDYAAVFGVGIGFTHSSYETFAGGGSSLTDSTLIYYAKATDTWGTPYYQYIGQMLPQYIPIPEDSAYWNYILQCPWYADTATYPGDVQVSTGPKINFGGHTYVQLVGVSGYFRNDTAGHKVYFTNDTSSPEVLLYDFTLRTSDSAMGNNFLYLDTITIGGATRMAWLDPAMDSSGIDYIEGIGSVYGFPGMASRWIEYYSYDDQSYEVCQATPVLQSFCAGGQTLYPNGASGLCFPLTVSKINDSATIHLYPNPTSGNLHLSISAMDGSSYHLILTDILGQKVYTAPVTQSECTFEISKLSTGIYTWRLEANGGIIKTGKVVKE